MYRDKGVSPLVENEPHIGQTLLQIHEALRRYCGISAQRYFLFVTLENGSIETFSGPRTSGSCSNFKDQSSDRELSTRVMDSLSAGAGCFANHTSSSDGYKESMEFPRKNMMGRQRLSDQKALGRQIRKRARARHAVIDKDEASITVLGRTRKSFKIGNPDKVWSFYEQWFKNCQQTACKLIAKAWVKAMEPKKQSTHPYTGSEEKAPDWWPKPWGPTKEDRVRHKEPDHLYKRERVHLLNHILRMIVEPNNRQHPAIQKLNLNVKKLEEITIEALSGFFADKESPANAKKRHFLNEIFRVAKQEERFKKEEIDGTTKVYVMADDKTPDSYASGNDDEGPMSEEEDDQEVPPKKKAAAHGLIPSAPTHSTGTSLHGTPLLGGELTVRGNQYTPSTMQDMAQDQHAFVENNGLPVNGQPAVYPAGGNLAMDMSVPASHDSGRRSSIFSTQTEYGGQNGTSMYTQHWQPGSTAPNSSSMYTFTQQQANPPVIAFASPGVPLTQAQPYMNASFDGLTRGYDPNQSTMFRNGGVPQQPQVHPAQGYDYMPHDNRELPGIKVDDIPRHAIH